MLCNRPAEEKGRGDVKDDMGVAVKRSVRELGLRGWHEPKGTGGGEKPNEKRGRNEKKE